MKKLIVFACMATTISMTTSSVMADSLKGKLGVTGKIGFISAADNNSDFFHNKTDAGFISAIGLLYGLDEHFAAELEVSQSYFGSETGDFGVTDLSLGGQYRFALSDQKLVPYLGLGIDLLATDYDPNFGYSRDVETSVGIHLSGGVDYFLQKNLALTAEARVIAAPEAKITDSYGYHRGNFDSSSFATTIGIRYFF